MSVYEAAVHNNIRQQLLVSIRRDVASSEFQAQGAAANRGSIIYGPAQDTAMNTGPSYVVEGAALISAFGVSRANAAKYNCIDKYETGASSASFDGKGGDYGLGSSPFAYIQKATNQSGANYNIKISEHSKCNKD